MPHPMRLTFALLGLFLLLPSLTQAETLQQIADRAKPGILGVAVRDLKTGQTTGINLDRKFPLQSVFKAFLAAAVLSKVDAGELSLDQKVVIQPGDLRDGVGPIDNSHGGTFLLRNVLRAAVIDSDNTAADNLLPLVGGPVGLTAWLQGRHILGIQIDRDERTMARDIDGIPATLAPGHNASTLRSQVPEATQHAAFQVALLDNRDTATPEAAVNFLSALYQENAFTPRLLSPESSRLLQDWMKETTTGPKRLKAGFPTQTILAHKTGTGAVRGGIALATNDIGIAALPDGRTLAIAVFLTASPSTEAQREALIADCARAAASTPAK